MRFLIDENLPGDLADVANSLGFDSSWVRDWKPGISDIQILNRLRSSGEILVTRDIRFANMIFALKTSGENYTGAVLIREQKIEIIRKAWRAFLSTPCDFQGFVVLTEKRTRVHRIEEQQGF